MIRKIIALCIVGLFFGGFGAFAQSTNKLTIPTLEGRLGKELLVPVSMTNSEAIAGIEVTIHAPQGLTVNINSAALSDRRDDHIITTGSVGNGDYKILIISFNRKLIQGNSGVLFTIPVTVPMDWEENSVHPFSFKQVILSSAQADNLATGADEPGAIRVASEPRPDIAVETVSISQSSVSPGEKFSASWTVKNLGDKIAESGWSEQVSFVDDSNNQTHLGTLYYEGALTSGNSVNRQAEFSLSQVPGIEGNVKLMVRLIPNAAMGELPGAQGNNTGKSNQYLTINKKLFLDLPTSALLEKNTSLIQCKLSRSGSWKDQQVFSLTAGDPSRISVPGSVTIPAQQSAAFFYIRTVNNTVLDEDSIVIITASGNGYEAATGTVIIEDDEMPSLTLTASKQELNEDDTFTLTIESERLVSSGLTVSLACSLQKRFNFPAQVVIPAGQKSVTATITVLDDKVPDITRNVNFTATAAKHNPGKIELVLHNNHVPVIELILAPQTVSESAGPLAVKGILRRTTNKDVKVTVRLTDDSKGDLFYSATNLVMNPGVEEAQFSIGVVDNAEMEGNRDIDVTAAVYISSCNCSISGTNAGIVKTKLTILDDDGPALRIASSQTMLLEGKTEAAILTVTRNTPTTASLTVAVSSDHDDELVYDKTVTIPAGSASVQIPVSALANGVTEGDRTVTFTATAEGFTKGICWAMITDQTLPDAIIPTITLSETNLEAGGKATLSLVVANRGAAVFSKNTPVNVYLSNNKNVFISFYTSKDINVDENETITQEITFPDITGNYTLYAIVNENQTVKELLYLNNKSESVSIRLKPLFTATVGIDKAIYKQEEPVIVSGQLSGNGIANAAVEVYVINSGVRQTVDAVSDASGHFQITFQPSVYQSGRFIVGACYPKEGLTTEQAAFNIYGLKRTDQGYITHDLIVNEPYQGAIRVTNTGTLALNNVRAEIISCPENIAIAFAPVSRINGNETTALNYTLTGSVPTEGGNWNEIKVRLLSDESSLCELIIYSYFRFAKGKLEASVSSIKTTMTKGVSRDYSFTLRNTGKGETGKITLSLPANAAWMTTATPREMASLASDESATVVLRFTPTNDLPLNVPIAGTIGINCANGSGLPLSFSIETVSESTGKLVVDVCDEYTYYTEEAPHLAGAKVLLKHPVTEKIIKEGVTDANGLFVIDDLPEGYYVLEVSAEKHDRYKNNILVDPGKETRKVVNLSFQAITIDWTVDETTVDDEYEIITTVNYETNVPVPVIVTELPDQLPVDELLDKGYYTFNAVLTNKGLITAHDVELRFPNYPELSFEYPSMDNLSLRPKESIIIPVRVSINGGSQPSPGVSLRAFSLPCSIEIITIYMWDCGLDRKWHKYPVRIPVLVCTGINIPSSNEPGNGKPGLPWGGGGGGGVGVYDPWINWEWPTVEYTGCEPCINSKAIAIIECATSFIPVWGCTYGIWKCQDNIQHIGLNGMTGWDYADCIFTSVSCATDICTIGSAATGIGLPVAAVCKIVGWVANGLNCLKSFIEPCKKEPPKEPSSEFRSAQEESGGEPSYFVEFREKAQYAVNELEAYQGYMLEYFGSDKWMGCSSDEISNMITYFNNSRTGDYINVSDPELMAVKPEIIAPEELYQFIERLNNTTRLAKGENPSNSNYIHGDLMAEYVKQIEDAEQAARSFGYQSMDELMTVEKQKLEKNLQASQSSVCSSITLQFSQTLTMTRQAFRGTLTVFNGHEDTAMQDVRLNLVVKDMAGNIATSHEFQINNESLKDFGGNLNGAWTLDAKKTGVATVVFIPTKYAALTESADYSFGGTLSYIDPFTGLEVTRNLYPAILTVKPSPDLDLTYFMQRDVFGDDPLTAQVEPIVPSEFSLLINNIGVGDATDLRMVTQQPKIIDNEKGLLINFELLSSQLNGGDHTLALGGSVATEFGNIAGGKTAYAQWWFTSSLLGHFVEYDVKATHITSYGNPDLSLLNEVTIHELIHSIRVPDVGNSFLTGFVVNDIVDADDLPDRIYLSDGAIEPVACTTNVNCIALGNNQYRLTVTPAAAGWNYGAVSDPTNGHQKILGIKRVSDNQPVDLRNFWQTDRTLRDGKDPLYENKLHFVDKISSGSEQYILTFTPRPNVFLEIEAFEGVPETLAETPVSEIKVRFNKNIDAATFTTEDIRLICQGDNVDTGLITITPVNEKEFTLGLTEVTSSDGYYELTVQTAGITDYEGYNGETGKTIGWTQYMGGQIQFNVAIEPAAGGTVTPPSGKYNFGSTLNLHAEPNEGYLFDRWSLSGETHSTEPDYNFLLLSSRTLTASFKLKLYDVTINYDSNAGNVPNYGTGKYEHGKQIVLRAQAFAGYRLYGWEVNGEVLKREILDTVIRSNMVIEALFTPITTDNLIKWTGLALNGDWHDRANWSNLLVPETNAIVLIPGNAPNFPVIKEEKPAIVGEIRFEPGAQIFNQQYLTGKTFVRYYFGENSRNRWHMLSVPLQEAYPDDFSFGGYPSTEVRKFTSQTIGNVTQANWNTANGSNIALKAGDSFMLWLGPNDSQDIMGLKRSGGIVELPFFDNALVPEEVHHNHDYDPGTNKSTFFNFRSNGSGGYERTDEKYSVDRTSSAYKLAGAEVEKTLNFEKNTETEGIVDLVGNPFIAALDFDSLYSYKTNSDFIKKNYQLWTGNGYQGYCEAGSFGILDGNINPLDQYIAPLQSFIVEKKGNISNPSNPGPALVFDVSLTSAGKGNLRSVPNSVNKLNIAAGNEVGRVLTFIAKRENGQDTFGDSDARKIINNINNIPEIYTLKEYNGTPTAVGANIIGSDNQHIPIGLVTNYNGNIKFTFTGMDEYDAYLSFVDVIAKEEIDLTGLTSYEYDVNYVPQQQNGETAACEDRFFIRISDSPNSLPEGSWYAPVKIYKENGLIQVVSNVSNPIKQVSVYSLQGILLHTATGLNMISYTINKKWPDGVYIVKVVSEKNVQNVKLTMH